ncbi:MAG: hypothetical protein A2017_03200 [Lentisphaerae bacterium GWF2_44_16]|nr:MAG: hypothetical protein A2017_03200 [Lentisphaerae bacterium GWF2_44_16]
MRKKLRKLKFTLIELLVVIAIIAILMGILIPAVMKVQEKARVTKAKGQMNAMVTAMKQYESTYGYLPVFGALQNASTAKPSSTDNSNANTDRYRQLIAYLTCAQGPGTATGDVNARKVRFLEAPSNYGTTTTAVKGTVTGAKVGDFYDPWGNIFQIFLDTNYDGTITSADAAGSVPACVSTTFNGTILIYSLGPNKTNDGGNNSIFGGAKGTDDVCSWR